MCGLCNWIDHVTPGVLPWQLHTEDANVAGTTSMTKQLLPLFSSHSSTTCKRACASSLASYHGELAASAGMLVAKPFATVATVTGNCCSRCQAAWHCVIQGRNDLGLAKVLRMSSHALDHGLSRSVTREGTTAVAVTVHVKTIVCL